MLSRLSAPCAAGDMMIRWDPKIEEEIAAAEVMVEELAGRGFSFFLMDGNPSPRAFDKDWGAVEARRIPKEAVLRGEPEVTAGAAPRAATPIPADAVTPRAARSLQEAGIATLERAAQFSRAELLKLPGIGVGAVDKLAAVLADHGLTLMREDDPQRQVVAVPPVQGG
jgi:hypothetical protein